MRLFIRLFSFLLLLSALTVSARVVRVEIASHQDVLNGKTFGEAGAYERLTGRIYFSLPVANPHNQPIVDLNNAVNLKNGEVEFSATFMALRPKDSHKGNGSFETRGQKTSSAPIRRLTLPSPHAGSSSRA